MLQSDHLSRQSFASASSQVSTEGRQGTARFPVQVISGEGLAALRESLSGNMSMNKRAVINRLIDLYEQGAIS